MYKNIFRGKNVGKSGHNSRIHIPQKKRKQKLYVQSIKCEKGKEEIHEIQRGKKR